MFKKIMTVMIGVGVAATAFAGSPTLINGAGSSFIYPALTKMFDVYSSVDTGTNFNYQSVGSGAGIKQVSSKTVDFGATDGPMSDEQMASAPGRIIHIPLVMGAVVLSYNIPGVPSGLKFTPDVLADIYLGKITSWNDARIVSANTGMTLPNLPIVVAHRSDGSGTSFIFTSYLTSVSGSWALQVGKGTAVNWPTGLGAKGNEGVSGIVKQTPGAIGYVELAYAVRNKLPYANMQNKSGNFIEPTIDSTSKAAAGVPMPSDFRVSIVNSSNSEAYPICGFSWVLVYKNQTDPVRGKALVDFLRWAAHDGQKYTPELFYAPLPSDVVAMIDKKLDSIKY